MEDSIRLLDYKKYPILYIDDERGNLEAFQDEFEDYFTIYTASSGFEGLRIIKEHSITLALVDQRMPEMTGVRALENIKKIDPRVLRILITAYSDIEAVIEGINKGNIYRYFKKPWDHEDIRTGIMRGLEHYHTVREREQLQDEKVENMKKMIRSNRLAAVGTMVSCLVHEIRNPMVAINSFFQLIPRKLDDKDFLLRFLEIAQGEVDRIEQLLENMLSFAKPARPALQPCDMNDLMDRVSQLLSFQAKKNGIIVDFQKGTDLPMMFADSSQIAQVVQNLGMNALQAMGDNGRLLFRSFAVDRKQDKSFIGLEIRDTGPGIPTEDIDKIFDPFFTTREGGTGLGLSISYQIINEHGGIVEVDSMPAKGTSIYIYIPVYKQKEDSVFSKDKISFNAPRVEL